MTFWDTPTFREYERLCGDEPGTRTRLLTLAEWQTRVVDLSLSGAELWQGVRKSYRSLIHAAERNYRIDVLSGVGAAGLIRTAQCVHRIHAGHQTRPGASWDRMGDMLDDGAMLVCAFAQEEAAEDLLETVFDTDAEIETPDGCLACREFGVPMAGFVFVIVFGHWAYYASAVSLRQNVNHALIWAAMKALKARGVRYFELGWQGEAHDEKGKQIEFYKRGFGGYDIPAKEAPALCVRGCVDG